MRRAWLTLAFAFAVAAHAEAPTSTANAFTAAIMLTQEPEEFVRKWIDSKEPDKPPMETAKTVRYGESIAALVLFRGCTSASGTCRKYVDYELVAPDGSIRYNVLDKSGTTEPNRNQRLHHLSHALVKFGFKPGDPLGTYTVRATIREPARGNLLRISEQFRVVR